MITLDAYMKSTALELHLLPKLQWKERYARNYQQHLRDIENSGIISNRGVDFEERFLVSRRWREHFNQ